MKKVLIMLTLILGVSAFAQTKEGVGYGYKDDIKVAVEMDGDKIKDIKVLANQDTPKISEPAIEELTKKIIETQSVEVEDIAGATYTSEGFKEAVQDALSK
ncbi:FMN-binding domain-containing protein [Cetobacterium ceti]|uniref:FMN-binding domain-containing protein n=1 Tax=Cetobacterium ceti TaxID=180163 RepID=A0A1T4LAK1_9FUSO|nr:FMN-binding protein [Cetobacterium ceti]SJZ51623.1 FMN-binding domain-containing protein [Cetobacterium ceti]